MGLVSVERPIPLDASLALGEEVIKLPGIKTAELLLLIDAMIAAVTTSSGVEYLPTFTRSVISCRISGLRGKIHDNPRLMLATMVDP